MKRMEELINAGRNLTYQSDNSSSNIPGT